MQKKFFRNSIATFSLECIGVCIIFLIQILFSNSMTQLEYGTYRYLIALFSVLLIISLLGTPQIILKKIASMKAFKESEELKTFIKSSVILYLFIALIDGSVVYFVFYIFDRSWNDVALPLEYILCIYILFQIISSFQKNVLSGLNKVILSKIAEKIVIPLASIVLLLAYLQISGGIVGIETAFWIHILGFSASICFGTILICKFQPYFYMAKFRWVCVKRLLSVSFPLLLAAPVLQVIKYSDTLMLGLFKGMESVADYGVAARIAELLLLGLTSVNAINAPLISSLYAKNSMGDLVKTVKFSARVATIFSFSGALFLYIFSEELLGIFGSNYVEAKMVLYILLVAQLVNTAVGPVGQILVLTEYRKEYTRITMCSAVVNLVLNYFFIKRWGAEGAALATAISLITSNILMLWVVVNKLGFNPSIINRNNNIKSDIDVNNSSKRKISSIMPKLASWIYKWRTMK